MTYFILIAAAFGAYRAISNYRKNQSSFQRGLALFCVAVFFIALGFIFGGAYAFLIFLATVMVAALYFGKTAGKSWGRPVAAVVGILGTVTALSIVSTQNQRIHEEVDIPESRVYDNFQGCGEVLGRRIRNLVKTNVVVLTDANTDPELTERFVSGLAAGIRSSLVSIVKEVTADEDIDAMPAQSAKTTIMRSPAMDVVKKHWASDMIVSLIPVPNEIFVYLWENREKNQAFPKFCLVGAVVGGLEELIKNQIVAVAILDHPVPPVYDPRKKSDKGVEENFNENFILIDSGNVEEMKKTYPRLW